MDQSALLEDLDRRQNEVLGQFAELNARIEALLKEWTKNHQDQANPDTSD